MNWDAILTSGITATVISGIVSYIVSRRLQVKEHAYQEEKERKAKAEAENAWRDAIRLNKTQKAVIEFCRAHPSERYNLQSGSGTCFLLSCDTNEKVEILDMTIRTQIHDMAGKGYLSVLRDGTPWLLFELTPQGKEHAIQ